MSKVFNLEKSASGYKGVSFVKRKNKYQAGLSLGNGDNRVFKFIGYYDTAELAHIARIKYIDNLK